jgi:hypothetical protein
MATILQRTNWFDGMQITETDMDIEQQAWHDNIAQVADSAFGSGIEKDTAIQVVLFDTDSAPASVQSLLDTENFDGEPIYPTDTFGNVVYTQPSDASEGNQLEVEISGAELLGSAVAKIFIFGTVFGGNFEEEVLVFDDNGSQITRKHFTKIIALMTQDFRGNQNILVDGIACRNVGGRLRILEALPMTLAIDPIMAEQSVEPNMDYRNFKPATLSKTLDILLDEIAATEGLNSNDLNINVTATTTRELPPDTVGLIIGEKFQATTDNIQKISLLLSVLENTLAIPGEEFNWSGEIVVGIRALQTTTTCPTDAIPGTAIEFDPEPSTLAEVSFNQSGLEDLGVSLNGDPQVVDFIFTQSGLAHSGIEVGKYYVVTIRRSGNISNGTIVLQEAANTSRDPAVADNMRMTVFSGNIWTDIPESDMWFKIYTDALRVVDGVAFDAGVKITIPKIITNNTTGVDEPFIEGHHNFIDVSFNTKNYAIVQKANNFTDPKPHPATGNLVFTRIEDISSVSVVSGDTLTTLLDAGNETIILGYAQDTNPVDNPEITGFTDFPGLLKENTFTIISPNSDVILNNLVGSILIPNTQEPELKYRIVKVEVFNDAYGDVNDDGVIDLSDVVRAQALDGYAKDLTSGTISSADQQDAIINGAVTMEEIIRADVNNDGVIDIVDAQLIQQNIALGTAFDAGSTFKRVLITVESLVDPLNTPADMIGNDASFNLVPFSSLEYRIDFVPIWTPSNLLVTDLRRFIPKTFTIVSSSDLPSSGGVNKVFVPDDLFLGGDLLDVDGNPYAIDLEVNSIIIDLPEGSTQGEVDIFNNFIKNQMKFSDGSFVTASALDNNQIKIVASIQSFVKDLGGDDIGSIDGNDPINETIAVLYTQASGILRVRAANIRNISTRPELRTKISLAVYLKKAGFKNTEVAITSSQFSDLLVTV